MALFGLSLMGSRKSGNIRPEEPARSFVHAPAVLWCDDDLAPEVSARRLLGDKAWGLREMRAAGIEVPPFFVITTAAVELPIPAYGLEPELQIEIRRNLDRLEREVGRMVGDDENPLLLAVRCSAEGTPAGLLPSVTNLGMTQRIAQTLFSRTADDRFVHDCHRRLVAEYARLVHDIDPAVFHREIKNALANRGVDTQGQLDGSAMYELARRYVDIYSLRTNSDFPRDAHSQLRQAILSAARAGESGRVMSFLRRGEAPLPVAVIVQAMVFGNREDGSLAGVAATRDPATGAAGICGEYSARVQAGDLTGGGASPHPLAELAQSNAELWQQLQQVATKLESHFRDAMEFEFTVEQRRLWVLHARPAGRSAQADIVIAVDLAERGILTHEEAIAAADAQAVEQLLHPRFAPDDTVAPLTYGHSASPGAAVGQIAFTSGDALRRAASGQSVILVRGETDASDVIGMQHCAGILTSTGGMTSHAAVVARGMGKCCIVGAASMEIDEGRRTLRIGETLLRESATISLDGSSGAVFAGARTLEQGRAIPQLQTLLGWADERRTLSVYANVDTPEDARIAVSLGAQGVGLCRTEHMFFEATRILEMRKMILAGRDDVVTRDATMLRLLAYQRDDFVGILQQMQGRPVVIRLLDPPLHEFLPRAAGDIKELARNLGLTLREVGRRIDQLREANPMLGHRGCRLLVSHPDILRMQVRAIIEAGTICQQQGVPIHIGIMVPLIIGAEEMALLAGQIRQTAERAMRELGMLVEYEIGAMIETPRAAIMADAIAAHARFISFGTNDLTQMTLAISRDDAGRFLGTYEQNGLLSADPFRKLDEHGVGELIRLAITRARAVRPDMVCGVCGEHAGDADSIAFLQTCGIDYISCSPRRLPVARLVAAKVRV